MSTQAFEQIGTGLTVFTDDRTVEAPVVWLDSPTAVIDFITNGDPANTIVIARGGTTTFLTPALTAGVKGVLTLQGAPTSHLGILSREYGIPCIMGVRFQKGIRTSRGETIPADGATVRMDITASEGRIEVEEGAPVDDTPPDADAEAAAAAQAEQVAALLASYRGETGHGSEGDEAFRKGFTTKALHPDEETTNRDLRPDEVNEVLSYQGWNIWDFLSLRATEGESGLIPRQEYELLGTVQGFRRLPEMCRLLTERVGVDGLYELGATQRKEVGSKANLLHIWSLGIVPTAGRGVLSSVGLMDPEDGWNEVATLHQTMRRLYRGAWGDDGAMYTSMRNYKAPLLEDHWIERFRDEVTDLSDPDLRSTYQKFSASTELMGFLLHFDNRCGLADTGPYFLPDGSFVVVRDHFLSDDVYHWSDVAEGLPHAITQAMFFKADTPIELALMDGSTLFTEPSNYLKHLTGMAVYARDRWDTPISDLRRLTADDLAAMQKLCDDGTDRLYRRIARMPKRDKIMAGIQVYYTDFILPWARKAGIWDELVNDHDFFEIDPKTSEAYYTITNGSPMELAAGLFLMGGGTPPFSPGSEDRPPVTELGGGGMVVDAGGDAGVPTTDVDPELLVVLNPIALRGSLAAPPGDLDAAKEQGLVVETSAGYMLSEEGTAAREALAAREREGLDTEKLHGVYERFLAINDPLKKASSAWHDADEDRRFELLGEVCDIVERVSPIVRRSAEVLPRFAAYADRLDAAAKTAEDGDLDYVVSPKVESVHTVWMELHEDYLQTLGISREDEGSY